MTIEASGVKVHNCRLGSLLGGHCSVISIQCLSVGFEVKGLRVQNCELRIEVPGSWVKRSDRPKIDSRRQKVGQRKRFNDFYQAVTARMWP